MIIKVFRLERLARFGVGNFNLKQCTLLFRLPWIGDVREYNWENTELNT